MSEQLVSIIMGAYNAAPFMQDAIDSILKQTHTNWEFVICDDGSTDDTYERLCDLARRDSRFVIIRNDGNKGLPFTLNHCIEHCRGEFIARMDTDDISYPERFERQIAYLNEHPQIAFVSASVDIFDGEKITSVRGFDEFPTKRQMVYNTCFVHPATMFRADALRSVGGYRVAEETRRGQDYDLFMRMYGAGLYGANILTPLYRYTEDQGTVSRRNLRGRIGEYKIRRVGFRAMRVYPWAFPFLFKPFAAHLLTKGKSLLRKKP